MYGMDSFEITDSLPCSQQPATGPYPQPDEPTSQPQTLLFLTYFIIVLLSSPTRSSRRSFSFRISHQNLLCLSLLYDACRHTQPLSRVRSEQHKQHFVGSAVQITKLPITQRSPVTSSH
jgi:hypothetical protein